MQGYGERLAAIQDRLLQESDPEWTVENVEPLEVFEYFKYYDGPILFTTKLKGDQLFLCVWAYSDEICDTWLLAPIDERTLSDAKAHKTPVYDLFRNNAHGWVLSVQVVGDKPAFTRVSCAELTDSQLPDKGIFLTD